MMTKKKKKRVILCDLKVKIICVGKGIGGGRSRLKKK